MGSQLVFNIFVALAVYLDLKLEIKFRHTPRAESNLWFIPCLFAKIKDMRQIVPMCIQVYSLCSVYFRMSSRDVIILHSTGSSFSLR